jgi:hypothetical protein
VIWLFVTIVHPTIMVMAPFGFLFLGYALGRRSATPPRPEFWDAAEKEFSPHLQPSKETPE